MHREEGAHVRHGRSVHIILALSIAFALFATPAFAEGYNASRPISDIEGWGSLSDNAALTSVPSGIDPHGGYTTTTNLCADCHSTHYSVGSYMLLRANSREAACDFCHGGGGGSSKNIMMDNDYTTSAVDMAAMLGSAADSTTTSGFGTGHTLGYEGFAPDDIRPAFSEPEGFSCFNCHSPHGNTARTLTTFYDTGREIIPSRIGGYTVHYRVSPTDFVPIEVYVQWYPEGTWPFMERVSIKPLDKVGDGAAPEDDMWIFAWGVEYASDNIVTKSHTQVLGISPIWDDWVYDPDFDTISPEDPLFGVVTRRPIFPTGKFLLVKNPDDENGAGRIGDLAMATEETSTPSGTIDLITNGNNKMAIDWDDPFGPGITAPMVEGPLDIDETEFGMLGLYLTGADERFAFPAYFGGADDPTPGLATAGEFCTDCHDGAAGLSTQAAEVWVPEGVTLGSGASSEGTYAIAYGHDANPRGCDRQLFLNPTDAANFGPQCRECHSGAGSCAQCHSDPAELEAAGITRLDLWVDNPTYGAVVGASAYTTDIASATYEPLALTTFEAQPSFTNIRNSTYVSDIDAACLDGGFSYPHRTLAVNMLKDALYGVDFDGQPLAAGEIRGAGQTLGTIPGAVGEDFAVPPEGTYLAAELVDVATHDMDSVCLDCHNPTIWNPSLVTSETVYNFWALDWMDGAIDQPGMATSWDIVGWDLLLKGLP